MPMPQGWEDNMPMPIPLYPSISLPKMGRDNMPMPQGWEGNYAYLYV
jgi:hypothetical protein